MLALLMRGECDNNPFHHICAIDMRIPDKLIYKVKATKAQVIAGRWSEALLNTCWLANEEPKIHDTPDGSHWNTRT